MRRGRRAAEPAIVARSESGLHSNENLRPFAELLGWQIGYRLSDADWETLAARREGRRSRPLGDVRATRSRGRCAIALWIDRSRRRRALLDVEMEAPPAVEAAAETAISIMQAYRLALDASAGSARSETRPDHPFRAVT
jgi:hypothetical protein